MADKENPTRQTQEKPQFVDGAELSDDELEGIVGGIPNPLYVVAPDGHMDAFGNLIK